MANYSHLFKGMSILMLTILLALGAGGIWLFRASLPDEQGEVELKGLNQPVTVFHDTYGVPHIFATTQIDAVRVLGYLHASERFFQMEMQRRAGQGRLAEVVGADMLSVDKFIRTLGFYGLAESSFASMGEEARNNYTAYAEGVNNWLATHKHRLPPELVMLGIKPEPWRPADSVVWGKLMALQLSHNYQLEILRAQLASKLSPVQMKFLFPLMPDAPITIDPKVTHKADATGQSFEQTLDRLAESIGMEHGASNEWVISGARTQTGKPILANDPHLSLEAPILWYLARIVTPGWWVKGGTVPGLPAVVLGQNNAIAWGLTTTGSDVQDLFIETVDPKNSDRYLTPQGSAAFLTRKELIRIKGAESEVLTVRTTRHGPVLSDLSPEMAALAGPGKVMALAFTGLGDRDRTGEALLGLDRAQSWSELLNTLRLDQTPPQNIVFADIKGDIGFINPGLVPVRKKGDGLMPVDGASGAYDWVGWVPFEELPQAYNPPVGFIFNANNAVVSASNKRFLGIDWEEPYRAMRLQQFFDSIDQHTLDSSAMMQADSLSLVARQLLPFVLNLSFLSRDEAKNARAAEAVDRLRGWDGVMDKDRPEPMIFEAWLWRMHDLLLTERVGISLKERGPYAANSIAAILAAPLNGWCTPGACDELASRAMLEAIDWITAHQGQNMDQWRWGKAHRALLRHKVFSRLPWLSNLSDLSVASSGDFYTLNRGGSFNAPDDNPFAKQHGGGYRGIYDLANPDRSRFMIATGESGHLFSPHYGDLVQLWNDVKAITLSGSITELRAQHLPMLEFHPVDH